MASMVYLVGAGPGGAERVTVTGRAVSEEAHSII